MFKQIETMQAVNFSKQEFNGKVEVAVMVNGIYVRVFENNGEFTAYANTYHLTGRQSSSKKLGKKQTAQIAAFVKANIEKF